MGGEGSGLPSDPGDLGSFSTSRSKNGETPASIAEAIQCLIEPVRLSREKQELLASATEAARKKFVEVSKADDTEVVASAHLAWVACKDKEEAYIRANGYLLPQLREALDFIFQRMLSDDVGRFADGSVHFSGSSPVWFSTIMSDRSVRFEFSTIREVAAHEQGACLAFHCVLQFTVAGHVFVDSSASQGFVTESVPKLRSWREGIIYAIRLLESVCKRWGRSLARQQKTVSRLGARVQSEMDAMKVPPIGRFKTSKRK